MHRLMPPKSGAINCYRWVPGARTFLPICCFFPLGQDLANMQLQILFLLLTASEVQHSFSSSLPRSVHRGGEEVWLELPWKHSLCRRRKSEKPQSISWFPWGTGVSAAQVWEVLKVGSCSFSAEHCIQHSCSPCLAVKLLSVQWFLPRSSEQPLWEQVFSQ